jgi:hypothetical protein
LLPRKVKKEAVMKVLERMAKLWKNWHQDNGNFIDS